LRSAFKTPCSYPFVSFDKAKKKKKAKVAKKKSKKAKKDNKKKGKDKDDEAEETPEQRAKREEQERKQQVKDKQKKIIAAGTKVWVGGGSNVCSHLMESECTQRTSYIHHRS
jgi:Rieske Fe-S protein